MLFFLVYIIIFEKKQVSPLKAKHSHLPTWTVFQSDAGRGEKMDHIVNPLNTKYEIQMEFWGATNS